MAPLAQRQRELDRDVMESFRALLIEHDPDLWEKFIRERTIRFAAGMTTPRIRLNLMKIVEEMDLTEEQRNELDGLLDAYMRERSAAVAAYQSRLIEWEMSRAQRTRERLAIQAEAQALMDAAATETDDPWTVIEAGSGLQTQFHHRQRLQQWAIEEPHRRLGRTNETYAAAIEAALGESSSEVAEEFRDKVNRAAYAEAFTKQPASDYIRQVLALNLDDETRHTVEAEAEMYKSQDATLRRRVIEAIDNAHRVRDRRPTQRRADLRRGSRYPPQQCPQREGRTE